MRRTNGSLFVPRIFPDTKKCSPLSDDFESREVSDRSISHKIHKIPQIETRTELNHEPRLEKGKERERERTGVARLIQARRRCLIPWRFFPACKISPLVRVQRSAPACRNHPHNNGSVVARACHSYKERAGAYARSPVLSSLFLSRIYRHGRREKEAGRKEVKA